MLPPPPLASLGNTLQAFVRDANCVPKAATVLADPPAARSATRTTQQQRLVQHLQMLVQVAHLATGAGWTAQVVCVGHACKARIQVRAVTVDVDNMLLRPSSTLEVRMTMLLNMRFYTRTSRAVVVNYMSQCQPDSGN